WIPKLKHYAPGISIFLVGTKLGELFGQSFSAQAVAKFLVPDPFRQDYVYDKPSTQVGVYMTNQVIADPCGGVFISVPKKLVGGHGRRNSSYHLLKGHMMQERDIINGLMNDYKEELLFQKEAAPDKKYGSNN
ncbi:hypothetical protein Tco_1537354, partial [Tanacetum coccineum]